MCIVQQAHPYTCPAPGDLLFHTVVALAAEKAAEPFVAQSKVEGNVVFFGEWLQLVESAEHWGSGSGTQKRVAAWDALIWPLLKVHSLYPVSLPQLG